MLHLTILEVTAYEFMVPYLVMALFICTGIDYFLTDKIDGKEPEEE